ncbi:MAG: phosphatidylserine decarboxylase family protein [Bacteroidales bacterium]|nr:phosphatidylserine decarboxylase family protein [Bacteroidales bacterium]
MRQLLDKDSYGTIAFVWIVSIIVIVLVAIFIKNRWVSIPICAFGVFMMAFITYFFRVPVRTAPEGDNLVGSVADGKIVIVEKVFEKEYLQKECIQVSIFMNFFDVHCNFWPVSGSVSYYKYHPGRYLMAFLPKSSELNEHSSTAVRTPDGTEIFFKQIAGTFARRIVCYAENEKSAKRGVQCGVIKFGSRIDIFLPLDADIKVKVGDKVRAVESVIATLR